MTWDDAQNYCITNHTQMAHVYGIDNMTTMMNIPNGEYTGKAWIGLYRNPTEWTWVNGQPLTYQKWGDDDDGKKLCAYITENGTWKGDKCIAQKLAVCTNGEHKQ